MSFVGVHPDVVKLRMLVSLSHNVRQGHGASKVLKILQMPGV